MTLPHVSWSQVELYGRCPRRWWFSKHRPDLKEEETDALRLGTECHEMMEAFYEGRPVPAGREPEKFAAAYGSVQYLQNLPSIPPRGAQIRIEYPRSYQLGIKISEVPVKGRIDLLWAKSREQLAIWDWKTLSSWKTAKSADELERFGQFIIYGSWAFQSNPKLETVEFAHGQILTKGTGAKTVITRPLSRDEVLGQLPPIEAIVSNMSRDYTVEDPADVACNTGDCFAFRRTCPYADICPKSAAQSLGLDDFDSPTTPAAPTPTPASKESSMSLKEKLKARAAATSSTQAATATPAPTPAASAPTITEAPKPVVATATAAPINPPDAATPTSPSLEATLTIKVGATSYVVGLPVRIEG